jgi:transposase InsO family protein
MADNMRAENNFNALKMALNMRGIDNYRQGLIHHSDKGAQYASDIYTETLAGYGIQVSMCEEVYENTHIERVNDTIKNQYLNRMDIRNEKHLLQTVARVIETYNNMLRPHKSLDGMPPAVYEEHIKDVVPEKRTKMEIYTVQKDRDFIDPNQLKLVFT